MPDKDKPLISPQSPSIARANKEWQNPSETADPELVAALLRLCELSHAAAFAFEAAGDKGLESSDSVAKHRGRAAKLAELIRGLGATPPLADEVDHRRLPVSAEEIAYLASPDAVTAALARDEQVISDEFANLGRLAMPESVRTALDALK